ncbi:MAG: uracil-DNA glycosylase [Bacteroidota bacterium]|nr:uracil-DNA glycosylase [Bacteroidota bacterium]
MLATDPLIGELRDLITQEIGLHGPLIPQMSFAEKMRALIPKGHPVLGLTSLDEIGDYVARTQLAPIDADRQNPVPGDGDPQTRIVVIGEAPGAREDQMGRPFVGRAGQLLNKMLAAIDLDRQNVFVTNILKTRPPGNRDPSPEEIAAHIPILYQQLALIRPLLILCLGRHAGRGLLQSDLPLKGMRGSAHDFYGVPLFVTYHPAALLRNTRWKRPAWEDLQMFQRCYQALNRAT